MNRREQAARLKEITRLLVARGCIVRVPKRGVRISEKPKRTQRPMETLCVSAALTVETAKKAGTFRFKEYYDRNTGVLVERFYGMNDVAGRRLVEFDDSHGAFHQHPFVDGRRMSGTPFAPDLPPVIAECICILEENA